MTIIVSVDAAREILTAEALNQETTVSEDQLINNTIIVSMDAARGILTARAPNQETTVSIIKESIVSGRLETC